MCLASGRKEDRGELQKAAHSGFQISHSPPASVSRSSSKAFWPPLSPTGEFILLSLILTTLHNKVLLSSRQILEDSHME